MRQTRQPRVVFDCNVFLQAFVRRNGPAAACLKLAEQGRIRLVISPAILSELRKVLLRPKVRAKFPVLTPESVAEYIQSIAEIADLYEDVSHLIKLPRDPKDEPYINLSFRAKVRFLLTRDKDLLEVVNAPHGGNDYLKYTLANVTITSPDSFLETLRQESAERGQQVVALLRQVGEVSSESRVDIEWTNPTSFRATEVGTDFGVIQRLAGFIADNGGIIYTEEPDLSFEQLRVYDLALKLIEDRVFAAEENETTSFLIAANGELPDLLHDLDHVSDNIHGCVRDGLLPVWHSIENYLQLRGYRVLKYRKGGGPWEIRAEARPAAR